jgi:hypothetical protein
MLEEKRNERSFALLCWARVEENKTWEKFRKGPWIASLLVYDDKSQDISFTKTGDQKPHKNGAVLLGHISSNW